MVKPTYEQLEKYVQILEETKHNCYYDALVEVLDEMLKNFKSEEGEHAREIIYKSLKSRNLEFIQFPHGSKIMHICYV